MSFVIEPGFTFTTKPSAILPAGSIARVGDPSDRDRQRRAASGQAPAGAVAGRLTADPNVRGFSSPGW